MWITENQIIKHTDAYHLPTIQEILESLAGARVFSALDLNSGYWQVKGSRIQSKTHFHLSFRVMPFGLKNAAATFQGLMDMVLVELKGHICFVYLDNIIVYSTSWQQHFMDVQAVMDKLREAGLTANVNKSKFFRTSLTCLGHVVSSNGVQVDPEKTQAVQSFPVPTNRKSLEWFLA